MTGLYLQRKWMVRQVDKSEWGGLVYIVVFAYFVAWASHLYWFCGATGYEARLAFPFLEFSAFSSLLLGLFGSLKFSLSKRSVLFSALMFLAISQVVAQVFTTHWMPYLVAIMSGVALGISLYICTCYVERYVSPKIYWFFSVDIFIVSTILVAVFHGLKMCANSWLTLAVNGALILFLIFLCMSLPADARPIVLSGSDQRPVEIRKMQSEAKKNR